MAPLSGIHRAFLLSRSREQHLNNDTVLDDVPCGDFTKLPPKRLLLTHLTGSEP